MNGRGMRTWLRPCLVVTSATFMLGSVSFSTLTAADSSNDKAAASRTASPSWFEIFHEDYSPTPETDPTVASFFAQKMGTGKEIVSSLTESEMDWFKSNGYAVSLNKNASTEVLQRRMVYEPNYAPGTYADILQEWGKMKALSSYYTNTLGKPSKVWWDIMAEWDGSGFWMAVPQHPFFWENKSFPAKADAYTAFKNYYFTLNPLGSLLKQTPAQRGTNVYAVTDQGSFAAYPYQWGIDMNAVETATETVNDIQTSIAFLRGAAKQYGSKPWGVDVSFWQFLSATPSTYDENNKRTGGFSESYLARHMYAAYMNGANALRLEPVILNKANSSTELNPLGTAEKAFADFSLTRHPRTGASGIGTTEVPAALIMPFDNGYDARHWQNQRGAGQDKTWYKTYDFTDGDWMIDNLFNQLYPDYWKHGTNIGAPYTDNASYTSFLAGNGDTRPYEPIGNSKWGDSFDVLYDNASDKALSDYKLLILSGDVKVDKVMRKKLKALVEAGGTLIANVNQVTPADEELLGVKLTSSTGTGNTSSWLADSSAYVESAYTYAKVKLTSAKKAAVNSNGDAIITLNKVGRGKVYLTTPAYMQNNSKDQLLHIGSKLIDTEIRANVSATLEGKPAMYIVNTDANKVVVMVMNNSGTTWDGNVVVNKPSSSKYKTQEWITDTPAISKVVGGKVKISASVPAYDVRVYAITW
ncbi:hypothetical protein [Paenibacillus sp. OV219]|uniref:hypothetical protein n=1 Tax=Paenibacillus sp. OV219 TaxID=1884377 RepID=UPI0008ABA6C1|nr:hypothetical protein [Paenibacillus sp. OV219]SEO05034.1 hypothetical protein SAMN05518847_105351 [Paenibacillus sp. OV219]